MYKLAKDIKVQPLTAFFFLYNMNLASFETFHTRQMSNTQQPSVVKKASVNHTYPFSFSIPVNAIKRIRRKDGTLNAVIFGDGLQK